MSIGTPYLIGDTSTASGANTIAITVAQATASGDAIIIAGSAGGSATTVIPSGVTDTQGNVYVLTASQTASFASYYYVALNAKPLTLTGNAGAPDVITATYAGTINKNAIAVGCSGVASVSALDQVATTGATSTAPSVTTAAQIASNDLAIAIVANGSGGGAVTWAAGWTSQASAHNGTTAWASVATQVLTTPVAVMASGTITSAAWVILAITLSATPVLNFQASPAMTVGVCVSSSGSGGSSVAVSANIDFSLAANTNGISIVNVWTASALSNYGLKPLDVETGSGNTLIAFVGWNGAAINPVSNLADDAHNWWQHLGTSSVSGDTRCAIWVAANAQAAECVSVGLSWFAQGLTVIVAEMAGLPVWASLDVAVSAFSNSAASLALSYTTTQADIAFAAICQGNNGASITKPGSWSTIGKVAANDPAGAGGPADTGLSAYWRIEPAQSVTPSWTASGTTPLSGVVAAISLSPAAPVQKNPNWPGLHAEMALGYQPGDVTAMPVWTDVTTRLIGASGDSTLSSTRGRQYESEGPEAGDLTIQLNNADGALTPGNTASPYYPNILLGTPVRVWGTWNNRTYAVASGYTSHDPQTWPDAQYGQVPWEATDALDPLSNSQLPSALAGDILADAPYGYWPCGDLYLQGQAAGQFLANLSRTNQRPMVCQNAVFQGTLGLQSRYLQTGLSWQLSQSRQTINYLGLPGDSSSAIGAAVATDQALGIAVTPEAGAFYQAPDMPQLYTGGGLTAEFFAIIDPTLKDKSHYIELFRLSGKPSNYYTSFNRSGRLLVRVDPDGVYVDVMDYQGNDFQMFTAATVTDGSPHHYAVTTGPSGPGGIWTVTLFLDGVQANSQAITSVNAGSTDVNFMGVGAVIHNDGGISYGYNYTAGQVALFTGVLPAARIKAHYATAWTGTQPVKTALGVTHPAPPGEDTVTRMAKLMTWGGFGLFRAAAPPSPSPLMGPADQVSGQSIADAGNTVATTDGGMMFCDAAGNATWWPRAFLYDRPVKWVLGDGPGEIPYDPGEAYDYDNTYIYNSASSQRQQSAVGNGVLAVAVDQASEKQYFTRGTLAQTVETTSDQDAYDQANWSLGMYKQPALRVQQVVLNPAANPSVWPAALGIEQGDIVQLTRRPLGGAVITQVCIVQLVSHDVGPDKWETTINMTPYTLASSVLTCDATGYDAVGSNGIGW